ncbi:MAG: phosphatase PAP2 family protein [Ferruginibacter sp.]|nr:phosphatase PAP2 family protein [Ferruginibacter sp.]
MNRKSLKFHLSHFYFVCLSLMLLFFLIFLMARGHAGSFLMLNSIHNKPLDVFFAGFTFIGDGIFAVLLCVILFLFIKTQRLSMVLMVSYIVSGLLAQLVKHFINSPRPISFFTPEQYNKYLEGVHIAGAYSFPSGHTTTAFALATVLACFTNKKLLQLVYLLLASLAGYSRIYLGQHFLTDVLCGAILGTLIAVITIQISEKIGYKKPITL